MSIESKFSEKKKLQIANICYANVASNFAILCKSATYIWKNFPDAQAKESDMWLMLNNISGSKKDTKELARYYAKEIAETLIERAGFVQVTYDKNYQRVIGEKNGS